jgi:hypothetical protein
MRKKPALIDKLELGSRIAVYFPYEKEYYAGNKNYHATVVKIKPERTRPHQVKYDKENRGKEWLDLHVHPFLDVVMEWRPG